MLPITEQDRTNWQRVAQAVNASKSTLESFAAYAVLRQLRLVAETIGVGLEGRYPHTPPVGAVVAVRTAVAAVLAEIGRQAPKSPEAVEWATGPARDTLLQQLGEQLGLAALDVAPALYDFYLLAGAQNAAAMLGQSGRVQLLSNRQQEYSRAVGPLVVRVAQAVAATVTLPQ